MFQSLPPFRISCPIFFFFFFDFRSIFFRSFQRFVSFSIFCVFVARCRRLSLFSITSIAFHLSKTDVNKDSPIDYKSGSACSTPTKDTLKSYDRNYSGPVLPPRSTMCAAPPHHYSAPLNFRKGLAAKCSWKCTAITVILLSIILLSALIFVAGMYTGVLYM